MPVDKEYWKLWFSDDNQPKGCNVGCLALVMACIAVDALAVWTVWQIVQGITWLVSLMAYA